MIKPDSAFPWTYDQAQRYAVLWLFVDRLNVDFGGDRAPGSGVSGRIDADRTSEPNRGAERISGSIRGSGGSRPLRVLDIGGAATDRLGTGLWLPAREILKSTPARVYVSDVSSCAEPGYIRASGTRLPFEDGAFDVVSAFDVLEHIPKEARSGFLAELGRVASRAILLSCPTRSPGVEQAEALLNSEILRRYGTEHGMLTEHRELGLPSEDEVSAALAASGLEAVSFGYGALSTWLTYQTFRSSFLLSVGADRTTEAIDRWWCGQPQFTELQAPFYRRFWIGSKTIGKDDLGRVGGAMKEKLERGLRPILESEGSNGQGAVTLPATSPDEFIDVERATREALARPFVSAVVATMGEPTLLEPCLDNLLTQVVDFNLEVAVWNLSRRPETAVWLTAHYPQVRRFEGKFSSLIENLRGDYIFLVDEKFQPASDAVSRYVDLIKSSPRDSVLAVSAPWRGGFPKSWSGPAFSAWKKAKGLSVKAGLVGDTSIIREAFKLTPKSKGWVIGDALFFRRTAVQSRKNQDKSDHFSIFLWEFK